MKTFNWWIAARQSVVEGFTGLFHAPRFSTTEHVDVVSYEHEFRCGAENFGDTEISDLAEELRRTAELEVVPAKLNGGHPALLTDTAEFRIVFVSLSRRKPKIKVAIDELGPWNPRDVDMSMTSPLYDELVRETWGNWAGIVAPEDRHEIVLSLADKILCGVS